MRPLYDPNSATSADDHTSSRLWCGARLGVQAAGLSARVELRVADALEALVEMPSGQQPFDLIFLDADKKRYEQYYEELLARRHPTAFEAFP